MHTGVRGSVSLSLFLGGKGLGCVWNGWGDGDFNQGGGARDRDVGIVKLDFLMG